MPGTERAYCTPTFSPDGQWLAFFDTGASELRKVSVGGGPVSTIVKAGGMFGATWGVDDTIVYADGSAPRLGLQRISSAGGMPMSITRLNESGGESAHRWPAFLPGGNALVFAIERGKNPDDAQIVAQRLDTGERKLLLQGGTYPHYVPAGYLAYVHGGRLMAVPFDARRLQVRGEAFVVSEVVQESASGASQFGFSSGDSLVYVPPIKAQRRLVWVSRDGAEQTLPAPPRNYGSARLSPDGRRVAVEIEEEIWIYDLSRDTLTRFTFEGTASDPVWTPDGKRITFYSDNGNIFWQLADGSGGRERLTTSNYINVPWSWSPDGQLLAFQENNPATGKDILILRLSDRTVQPFLRTPFVEGGPAFSPDGRWLAYASDESGRPEIYVRSYPGPGGKWQVSTEGGNEVVWNRSGIYYRSSNKMMAVEVAIQPTFSVGKPRVLFEGQYVRNEWPQTGAIYDVSGDGQRFLMGKQSGEQVNVVLNWSEEVKEKVPRGKT